MTTDLDHIHPPFDDDQVEAFITDGCVRLDAAFPRELAAAGRARLWTDLDADPDDPTTWTTPVVRLDQYTDESFQRAANTPRLHAAFDQLVGPGRWQPRGSLGTWPVRFPHPADPGDAGWHVEAASTHRDVALATGRAGDVWLCHPFIVHAAQPHHGNEPKLMAQPPLLPTGQFEPDGHSPVEQAIRLGQLRSSAASRGLGSAMGHAPHLAGGSP